MTRIASGPVHLVEHVVRSSGPLVVAVAEGRAPLATDEPLVATDEPLVATDEPLVATDDPVVATEAENATEATIGIGVEATNDPTGQLRLVAISGAEKSNFLTGATVVEFDDPVDLPFDSLPGTGIPSHLALNGSGSDVMVAWEDGTVMRIRRSEVAEAFVAEQGLLLPEGGKLESLDFVLGNTTLLWGDSAGVVRGGFTVPREGFDGEGLRHSQHDERSREVFAKTKDLSSGGAAAVALASSARSRLMLAGFADGEIRLYNVTNATELGSFRLPEGRPGAPRRGANGTLRSRCSSWRWRPRRTACWS